MHYYNFNIGDYIKHTIHLTIEEDICYRRLLDLYYDTERPIPNDIPWVSRRLRVGSEVVQNVLNEFFELCEVGYKNARADHEISEYHAFLDKQRSNGKLGGRPKKTHGYPSANPTKTQTEPKKSLNKNHKPINIEERKINKKKESFVPDDVDEQVWKDFVQQRNAIKAPVTQTALTRIRNEATKVGWDLNQALAEVTARGWRSFKAEWVLKDKEQNQSQNQKLGAARAIFGDERKSHDRNIIDITPTVTHALGAEDLSNDAGALRDSVPEHVEDRPDFI
jgi:uncharacterized protein YdaU (DUF1376 family)